MAEEGWRFRREGDLVWLSFEGWDGVRCLHSTRLGGVSSPPFDTLNLGRSVGDLEEKVEENRRRFGAITRLDLSKFVLGHQVHSDKVNLVDQETQDYEGDALVTKQKGVSLGVSVADCLAVYVYDPARGAAGLVHAGRRGTLKGIVRKALLRMGEAFGTRPEDCSVLFGPAIGPCCYEVGREIAERFDKEFPGSIVFTPEADQGHSKHESRPQRDISKTFLDLWKANELQLKELGVQEIVNSELCTCCRQDLFFSHRRDKGRTGRMLAIIESV